MSDASSLVIAGSPDTPAAAALAAQMGSTPQPLPAPQRLNQRAFQSLSRRRKQLIVIVLGTHTTKAVHLSADKSGISLLDLIVVETPVSLRSGQTQDIASHLRQIREALGAKTRRAVLVISMAHGTLRQVQLPRGEPSELRRIVELNKRNYLQNDLLNYVIDCSPVVTGAESLLNQRGIGKTLLAGAPQAFIDALESGARDAGLIPVEIALSHPNLANAAVRARPEIKDQVVALLDLGFSTCTVSIVVNGSLRLSRTIPFGGDRVTWELGEALDVNYLAAEGVKVFMPERAREKLQRILAPFFSDLRAAIAFFQEQELQLIKQVLVSGAASRSSFLIQQLQSELRVPCEAWDASALLQLEVTDQHRGEFHRAVCTLGDAIGAAIPVFEPAAPDAVHLNLLASKQEAERRRRNHPVRRAVQVAAALGLGLLAWGGSIEWKIARLKRDLTTSRAQLLGSQDISRELATYSRSAIEAEGVVAALHAQSTNRFLVASALNALQAVKFTNIQVVSVTVQQNTTKHENYAARANAPRARTTNLIQNVSLIVQAKNFGDAGTVDSFIEAISQSPYFRAGLRPVNPVVMKSRSPQQLDPVDNTKSFSLFTIECVYADKTLQ